MSILDSNDYLGYRPSFDIRRALRFRVEKEGLPSETELDLPDELLAASSILAADLIEQCDQLHNRAKALAQALSLCVERSHPNSIKIYEKALKDEDRHAVALFEDQHCADVSGSTQAELYVICKNIESGTAKTRPYILSHIAPVKPAEGVLLREAEENYYSDLAYMEYNQPNSLNRLSLAYEAQLKYQVSERLTQLAEIMDEVEDVAWSGYMELCKDNPPQIAKELVALKTEGLDSLTKVLEATYGIMANKGLNLNRHNRSSAGEEITELLQASLSSLTELRLREAPRLLQWLQTFDLEDADCPVYNIAGHLLTGLKAIDGALDTTILDLAKNQKAEYLNLKNRVDNIRQRKQIRQLLNLVQKIREVAACNTTEKEIEERATAIAVELANRKDLCQ